MIVRLADPGKDAREILSGAKDFIRLEPFRPEIMDTIVPRWPQALGNGAIVRDTVADGHSKYARIATLDGKPIGAGGVIELWPGVGHTWVLAGEVDPRFALRVVKAVLGFLDELQGSGKFHRLQADIRTGFFSAMRFAEILGFKDEGPMRGYSSDKTDYRRYSRVRM